MDSWDSLVSLWGPKAKPFREHLIAALTILLPYHVHAGKKHDWGEGLERLYKVMEKEVPASKGLSLDALRLEVDTRYPRDEGFPAFCTPTLRVTASFDQAQALIWATLELEADCIVKVSAPAPRQTSNSLKPSSTNVQSPSIPTLWPRQRSATTSERDWRTR